MIIAVQESLDFLLAIVEIIPDTPFMFLIGLAIVLTIIRGIFQFMSV